jgi:two-component system, LytTR family, response regulator
MINCVIVDDDAQCIQVLSAIINEYCPQLKITGTASSINDAVKLINLRKPQLVFLDVEIHDELGFDLFKFFSHPDFEVVFTTAHEKYALKAIKSSCFDFLMKPVNASEVVNVVSKLEKEKKKEREKNVDVLISNLKEGDQVLKKIAVPSSEGYNFIGTNEILSLEADGKYTKITTLSGLKSLSTKNIGEFEELLDPSIFYRTHKSWIVNLNHIRKFLKDTNQLLLSDDSLADVSSRKREDFLRLFGKV